MMHCQHIADYYKWVAEHQPSPSRYYVESLQYDYALAARSAAHATAFFRW